MRTEAGVQSFWRASLAWKGVNGYTEGATVESLFRQLDPLYNHPSPLMALARQAELLSQEIVKGKCRRKKVGGTVTNISALRLRISNSGQDTIAA